MILLLFLVGTAIVLLFFARMRRKYVKPPESWKEGVVYIHILPREMTKQVVNLSPFAIKLETWLRLRKIKYEVIETSKFSPKRRQTPFAWFNGEWLEDSCYIIEFLSSYFNIKAPNLSIQEMAISRAFQQMLEFHTGQIIFWFRYAYQTKRFSKVMQYPGSKLRRAIISTLNKFGNQVRAHINGISRDSPERVAYRCNCDFKALSDFLADKKYFFGDEMTEIDCLLFGILSQVVFVNMNYPQKQLLDGDCNNLSEYTHRIKDQLWPDWSQLCDTVNEFY